MHEDIVRFTREGECRDDAFFIQNKRELTRNLHEEMYDCGYIPVLDLNVHWSTSYCEEKKRYSFTISAYGVYVGGDNLSNKGMTDGKIINTA